LLGCRDCARCQQSRCVRVNRTYANARQSTTPKAAGRRHSPSSRRSREGVIRAWKTPSGISRSCENHVLPILEAC
jgi:hypothetical protein